LNLFEAWDFLAARKSRASILPVNEAIAKTRSSKLDTPVFEFSSALQERHLYRAMPKAQEDARQLLHSNPLVANCVGQLLKYTTAPAPLRVKWGEIKLGQAYVLSSTLTVSGRELKDASNQDGD
jgi:hypothetical protein